MTLQLASTSIVLQWLIHFTASSQPSEEWFGAVQDTNAETASFKSCCKGWVAQGHSSFRRQP